jgi:hypothetical protein
MHICWKCRSLFQCEEEEEEEEEEDVTLAEALDSVKRT